MRLILYSEVMQDVMHQNITVQTHGERISAAADFARTLTHAKKSQGGSPKLSKKERAALAERIAQHERSLVHDGVNFSRMNIGSLRQHQIAGGAIEFETLGPYLASYQSSGGVMRPNNLIPEDAIGLELAVTFRKLFPSARLVSLYDDYNANAPGKDSSTSGVNTLADPIKQAFKESLVQLYKTSGALTSRSIDGTDYLMVSESSMVTDVEILVTKLESKGHIIHKEQEILFINDLAENPLHQQIRLRSNKGKWLCEALDAATFLKAENFQILHIIALPDYMKDQQDKVWEILRVLGMTPYRYHNIFYSPDHTPTSIAQTVAREFARYS